MYVIIAEHSYYKSTLMFVVVASEDFRPPKVSGVQACRFGFRVDSLLEYKTLASTASSAIPDPLAKRPSGI